MALSNKEIKHIALLARIGVTEQDLAMFGTQLSDILEQFRILEQVDTTDIPQTLHTVDLTSVFREDKALSSLTQDEVLSNAPREYEGFFRVKAVLG